VSLSGLSCFREKKGKKKKGEKNFIKEWLKGNKSRRYYNLLESDINLIFMIRSIFNCLFQVVMSECKNEKGESLEGCL
jgi:hypothetical protein